MILWHLGTTLAILWFVFRGNKRLDYRIALVGALIPDLIDKPLGRIILRERFQTGRLYAHSLIVNVALFSLIFFLRGRVKRKAVLLPIGSLLHLFEDGPGLWNRARTFWWPLFGVALPKGRERGLLMYMTPGAAVQEVAGAALIAWVLAAHGMLSKEGIIAFLKTGHLEMPDRPA